MITQKMKPLTPNMPAINRLAQEIAQANVSCLVLVHGGGSFGHPLARRYMIKEGLQKGSGGQLIGFAKTHQAMIALNRLVVDTLIQHNIPAVAMMSSSMIVTKSGRICTMMDEPLKQLLQVRCMPVLYGDAVFDSDLGFTILSGDQVAAALAIQLNSERIIMGIDEDGLYTADPKVNAEAKLIHHIDLYELRAMRQQFEQAKSTDVTGGMLGKIDELTSAIERGIPSLIVNAAKPKTIYKALKGEKVVGTFMVKRRLKPR